ncbi:MAG: hypothetical protein JNM27_03965 [Leptospirales bacterium]|nr:hypothetical protein [Leptospirales bacterium]
MFYLLAFWIFVTVPALAIMARYDWNYTSLIRFGHRYVEQNTRFTPEGAVRLLGNEKFGGNGYDGQIFYYYARTLFEPRTWPNGFSNAYRAPRVGYPVLTAPFSVFGNSGVAIGMILVQLGATSAAIYCLFLLLPAERRPLITLFAFSPFLLQSMLFLVSDSVMVSLFLLGWFFFQKRTRPGTFLSLFFFSLAVLTKESSLFLLFPLGLWAVLRRDVRLAALLLGALVPMAAWQFYLFRAHGMVPASILSIFLSPLSGIRGVLAQTIEMIRTDASVGELARHAAKLFLIIILPLGIWAAIARLQLPVNFRGILTRLREPGVPFRAGALLVILSVLIADFQYFWGIFENVGRMFTALIPAIILARGIETSHTSGSQNWDRSLAIFGFAILTLSAIVWLRFVFLTPAFPFDVFQPYSGPHYLVP